MKKNRIYLLLFVIVLGGGVFLYYNTAEKSKKINYIEFNKIVEEINIYDSPYTINKQSDCDECWSFMKRNNIYEIIKISNGDILFLSSGFYKKLIGHGYLYTSNNTSLDQYSFIVENLNVPWHEVELY